VYRTLPSGQVVMRQEGDTIFLSGLGASPEGDRPFLDRLDLKTRKSERLFRSEKTGLEVFVAFTTAMPSRHFLTWHPSPKDPPNAVLRTLGDPLPNAPTGEAAVASTASQVTHIPDPTPVVRSIKQRLITYKRKDGTDLSFTLFTPPGYVEGTRVPAILN